LIPVYGPLGQETMFSVREHKFASCYLLFLAIRNPAGVAWHTTSFVQDGRREILDEMYV